MMNKKDRDLNKFTFEKMWDIREGITNGLAGYQARYKDLGWEWLKEEADKCEQALANWEELNDFLSERHMIKYPDDTYEIDPKLKKAA